jgi:hypothetical protein
MKEAGILPFLSGMAVADRDKDYYSETWQGLAGHHSR